MAETIPAWIDGLLVEIDKLEVHRRGLWHPAVSVFLMSGDRTLIQRRAAGKYHSPGLWANACCTHPRRGENPAESAARRLREELGVGGVVLASRGTIAYEAPVLDAAGSGGMVERERVELFVGEVGADLRLEPDPAEVAATHWIGLEALRSEIAARPAAFTPWLRIYLDRHAGSLLARAA